MTTNHQSIIEAAWENRADISLLLLQQKYGLP